MVTRERESCAIAFKEWAGVCDALVDGPAVDHPPQGGDQRRPRRGRIRPGAFRVLAVSDLGPPGTARPAR